MSTTLPCALMQQPELCCFPFIDGSMRAQTASLTNCNVREHEETSRRGGWNVREELRSYTSSRGRQLSSLIDVCCGELGPPPRLYRGWRAAAPTVAVTKTRDSKRVIRIRIGLPKVPARAFAHQSPANKSEARSKCFWLYRRPGIVFQLARSI